MSAHADPNAAAVQDRFAEATQLQLTWWRFRRHRLAVISLVVVVLFYLVAAFADFLAINDPHATEARRSFIPPQAIHFFDDSGFNPHVYGLRGVRDRQTFQLVYTPDPNRKLPVPADVPYVRVTGPSGEVWEWNYPASGTSVRVILGL